jgi:hypothetical protein
MKRPAVFAGAPGGPRRNARSGLLPGNFRPGLKLGMDRSRGGLNFTP